MQLTRHEKQKEIEEYLNDICQRQAEKSIYYFTYDDIIQYHNGDISYTDLYKFMPKFIKENNEYLRRGFPNEAHFIHRDYLKQYNEISLPQWRANKKYKNKENIPQILEVGLIHQFT